jgi:hypothetical protein
VAFSDDLKAQYARAGALLAEQDSTPDFSEELESARNSYSVYYGLRTYPAIVSAAENISIHFADELQAIDEKTGLGFTQVLTPGDLGGHKPSTGEWVKMGVDRRRAWIKHANAAKLRQRAKELGIEDQVNLTRS